jgi:hypothetical protein
MLRMPTASAVLVPMRGRMQEQVRKESSIGALMEHLSGGVLDQLIGAHITVEKVS